TLVFRDTLALAQHGCGVAHRGEIVLVRELAPDRISLWVVAGIVSRDALVEARGFFLRDIGCARSERERGGDDDQSTDEHAHLGLQAALNCRAGTVWQDPSTTL